MGELFHECGVAAIYHAPGTSNAKPLASLDHVKSPARLIPRMLLDMQNRGQLAAGMTSYNPSHPSILRTHKELGMVAEAFQLNHKLQYEQIMRGQDGPAAIGHVRYATSGGDDRRLAQPFDREHGRRSRWFSFAFNGQIANFDELRKELLAKGDYHLRHDNDTEIIQHTLSQEIQQEGEDVDWVEVFSRIAKRFDGAYNIVLLSAVGDLIVARDPLGLRPLCYAREGGLFAVASESVPLANLGFREIHSLEPGMMAIANEKGVRFERFAPSTSRAHCFFEWIYFASVASTLDDRSVYLSRKELGRELAKVEDIPLGDDLIVVPVPDTAKAAADSMAFELKLPSVEGLIRNRNVGRTFIEGDGDREAKVRMKYTPLPEVMKGKRVLLVEDSIVRSTTMRILVNEIRDRGGAREIHLRIACPPIISPCFYGIDMSKKRELFAPPFIDLPNSGVSKQAQQAMADKLGVESLRYLPVESIGRAIGLPTDQLCRACVTGHYPTAAGTRLCRRDADSKASEHTNGRTGESH